ncbi:MAG: PD-(D/E)XK nuclease family protein [Bacilli bacterium]|nr:PD-(D/E)XK nuclease family protein [Bacilli bacterium]
MEFLKNINEKTLIITNNNIKEKILEFINSLDKLINFKLMTKSEFSKHYFYDYHEETIYYVTKKYNLTVKNAIMYLDNIKYVIDSNIEDDKVKFLKEMYLDLKENNLLEFDDLFKSYLDNTSLIVLNKEEIEEFYLNIFNKYNSVYYSIENKDLNQEKEIYHFKTIEQEVEFIFNKISELLNQGISIQKIKLTNVTTEYMQILKRMSKFYNLNINNLEKNSIYATVITNKLLCLIDNNSSKEEIIEFINSITNIDIKTSFLKILNRYYFVDNYYLVKDLIKEDLKNTNLKNIKYKNAIEIIPLDDNLVNRDDFVFLVGFNLENIPKTYKDIDYLNDSLKEQLGLFTSLEKNKLEHEKVLKTIKNINNLIITYKDTDPYKSYYPSNLIEELGYKVIDNDISLNQTSNIYNKIKLTTKLDNLLKYGVKENDLSSLFNTYSSIPYLTYDNKFTGINNFKLNKLTLSYTSLDNYYHCKFRYYIDNILKLNIYEDTFKIYIGNLFHFILSKIFEDNFNFLYEFNNYIKDKEFTKKELFYLNILKEELESIINIIKYQHGLSGLNKVKLEENIVLKYQDNYLFKGIIDKIMYKEKDGNTYISLIDYKTGTPKTDMTNLIYGIDIQLPVYAYLLKKSNLFLNPNIIGFYFQKILHEKNSFDLKKNKEEILKDNLKLNGYSISDEYLVNMFDESYQNSELIKGMKMTSKGFSHYTKVITEEEIDELVNVVDLKIKNAFKEIREADFKINPKVIGGENIGCLFCKYKDLCFKTGSDYVYLEKKHDLSYLKGSD